MDDVGKLEACVKESATFMIFLSKWYFASKNCQRELDAALQDTKSVIPVWEADENKGGATLAALRQEAQDYCKEIVDAEAVLAAVLNDEANTPIVWVRVVEAKYASELPLGLLAISHSLPCAVLLRSACATSRSYRSRPSLFACCCASASETWRRA